MSKPAAHTAESLTDAALGCFWQHGYNATSMDDLVRATGVSRHGIYAAFGGKRELFLACFDRYQHSVVSPAFSAVEAANADLSNIAAYFEHQIARGEAEGFPGAGCFVANSATEVAPSDADVLNKVRQHQDRLLHGFANALRNCAMLSSLDPAEIQNIAFTLVTFTDGLWVASRTTADSQRLRTSVRTLLQSLTRT